MEAGEDDVAVEYIDFWIGNVLPGVQIQIRGDKVALYQTDINRFENISLSRLQSFGVHHISHAQKNIVKFEIIVNKAFLMNNFKILTS